MHEILPHTLISLLYKTSAVAVMVLWVVPKITVLNIVKQLMVVQSQRMCSRGFG